MLNGVYFHVSKVAGCKYFGHQSRRPINGIRVQIATCYNAGLAVCVL